MGPQLPSVELTVEEKLLCLPVANLAIHHASIYRLAEYYLLQPIHGFFARCKGLSVDRFDKGKFALF
jgi:hypothetical protein